MKIFEDRANLNPIHAGILGEIIVSRKENRKTRFSNLFLQIFPANENHSFPLCLSLYVDFSKNVSYFFFPSTNALHTRGIYKNSNIEYLRSKLKSTTTTTTTIRSHGKAERDALARRNEMKRNKRKTRLNIFWSLEYSSSGRVREKKTLSSSRT